MLRIISYVSLIACLMGNVLADQWTPPLINHSEGFALPAKENYTKFKANYAANPIYSSKMLLDEDHNLAISFPELLDNLDYHKGEAFGNYIMHTFFGVNLDNDRDGLIDYDEKYVYKIDPGKKDSDNDGLDDKKEFEIGTNPINSDTDEDGLLDGEEFYKTITNPFNRDTFGNDNGDYYESTHIKLDYFRDGSISCGYESPKIDIYLDKQLQGKIKQATMHLSWGSGKSGVIYMNDKFLANGEVGQGRGGLGWGCFFRWYGSMDFDLTDQLDFMAVPTISLRGDYIGDVRVIMNVETTEPIRAGDDRDYLKVGDVNYSPREWANMGYCGW
jgi:hypothetical protein